MAEAAQRRRGGWRAAGGRRRQRGQGALAADGVHRRAGGHFALALGARHPAGPEAAFGLRRQLLLDQRFDGFQLALLVLAHQRQRHALAAGAAGAANAVHVVFRRVGQLEIHHKRQFFDVQATGGHVGGHQHAHLTILERRQGFQPLALRLVAVNGFGGQAVALEFARELLGALAGAAEHNHLGDAARLQQMHQQMALARGVHRVHHLFDVFAGGVLPGHFHQLRLAHEIRRQALDFRGEGGREQQGLPIGRQQAHDAADVLHKAHVQHAVGFVQNQHFHPVEHHVFLLDVVQQTARRGHQHFHATAQRFFLRIHRHAAKHHRRTQRQVFVVLRHAGADLVGQFAGGGEDQRAHRVHGGRGAVVGVRAQARQQRQGEGGGLAGAGLGGGQHIAAAQHHRNGLGLNRRR